MFFLNGNSDKKKIILWKLNFILTQILILLFYMILRFIFIPILFLFSFPHFKHACSFPKWSASMISPSDPFILFGARFVVILFTMSITWPVIKLKQSIFLWSTVGYEQMHPSSIPAQINSSYWIGTREWGMEINILFLFLFLL